MGHFLKGLAVGSDVFEYFAEMLPLEGGDTLSGLFGDLVLSLVLGLAEFLR